MSSNDAKPDPSISKETWFATPVWYMDVPGSEEINANLLVAIDDERSKDQQGTVRSNKLGWHSQVNFHLRPEMAPLCVCILQFAQACHRDWKLEEEFDPLVDNCWANVSPKYAYNRSHTHPGVWLSGVYYVRTPEECGKLIFSDPRPQTSVYSLPVRETGPDTWRTVTYAPVEGRILLFPNWLPHEVEPNLSDDGDRISIAFNVALARKADSYESNSAGGSDTD